MNINERIRNFRKNVLRLSQTEFATQLGMKQTSVSTFEKSGATVTDPTIKALCMAFNLNEDWLRNGTEPMYIQAPTFSLEKFVRQHSTSDTEYELLLDLMKTYFDIDEDIRRALVQHFKERISSHSGKSAEQTVEDTEAVYKKSRLRSVQKEKLSASNITADTGTTDNEQKNIV